MDNESHNLLISSRINELTKERNISINELSKRSKIPQSTLANILVRKKNPTIPTLYKICNGLNMSLVEFFNFLPYK